MTLYSLHGEGQRIQSPKHAVAANPQIATPFQKHGKNIGGFLEISAAVPHTATTVPQQAKTASKHRRRHASREQEQLPEAVPVIPADNPPGPADPDTLPDADPVAAPPGKGMYAEP